MHVKPKGLCRRIALGVCDRNAAEQVFFPEDFRVGAAWSNPCAGQCHGSQGSKEVR